MPAFNNLNDSMNLSKKEIVNVMKEDPSRVRFERTSKKSKYAEFLKNVSCDRILQTEVIFCIICQKLLCKNANTKGNLSRHFKQHNPNKFNNSNTKESTKNASERNKKPCSKLDHDLNTVSSENNSAYDSSKHHSVRCKRKHFLSQKRRDYNLEHEGALHDSHDSLLSIPKRSHLTRSQKKNLKTF